MASFKRSEDIDVLSIRKLYVKGDSNTTLAANSILATDGLGGTKWLDVSTVQGGVTFNRFVTTPSTFSSGPGSATFSILDGPNAGLIPSASGNSVIMYSKAFGQIDVQGQSSIYSFDTYTGTINSSIKLVGSGIVNISTDTTKNLIKIDTLDNGISSLSTVLGNFIGLNTVVSNTISSFKSPFSTFIYDAVSSFSTSLGSGLGSTITTQVLNTNILNVSGSRLPFIQYGSASIPVNGHSLVSLPQAYINAGYTVQLTYSAVSTRTKPLYYDYQTRSSFIVYGDANTNVSWTTYGNLT